MLPLLVCTCTAAQPLRNVLKLKDCFGSCVQEDGSLHSTFTQTMLLYLQCVYTQTMSSCCAEDYCAVKVMSILSIPPN